MDKETKPSLLERMFARRATLRRKQEPSPKSILKSFEEDTVDIPNKQYRKIGIQSIEIKSIVGSVGRAHELNANFVYRDRRRTGRYHRIEADFRQGRPSLPIEVIKVQREGEAVQYFVVDGHHRVAIAKQHGAQTINADIIEVYSE